MLQRGGRRGTNPLTALLPFPLSLQFPANNHSHSVNIHPTPPTLHPMNDFPLQRLAVLVSRTTVPNGTTSLSRRSNPPRRRTNNPTSRMGMDTPNHRPLAETTTIAMVPPKSTGGAVRGRLSTMTTRNTIPGRPDAYATTLFYLSPFILLTAHLTEWSTKEPSTRVSFPTSFRLCH